MTAPRTSARSAAVWAGLGLLVVAVLMLAPCLGLEFISPSQLWRARGEAGQIFWSLRLPRVVAGMLTGGMLAASGLTFQALFRNPLATPFTLGTASGASFGATCYLVFGGAFTLAGISGITVAAFAGALLSLGLAYGFSRVRSGFGTETMLLTGVALSFMFSSLILLLQYLADQSHSLRVLRWLMGGLDAIGWAQAWQPLPFALAGVAVLWSSRHVLDLLNLGEDLAQTRGVNVRAAKGGLLVMVGLMESAVVAVAGPVGFIGLMVPHICRLCLGPEHTRLLPASVLLGAAFLPACDALARMVVAPAEMPVGIITALLGAPFFLWLLLAGKTRG